MTHFSDGLTVGTVVNPAATPPLGLPVGIEFVYDITPLTLQPANVAASQTPAGAGALTLTAGTGTTSVIRPDGSTVIRFDVPRSVSFTSAANLSGVTFTVSGYDGLGAALTQTLAGPNITTVNTLKAFRDIKTVTISGVAAGAVTVGMGDTLGLPVFSNFRGLLSIRWSTGAAEDTGTYTAGDTTSPATAATGDVRGTYLPSTASNGSRRLYIRLALAGNAGQTLTGTYGVTQV